MGDKTVNFSWKSIPVQTCNQFNFNTTSDHSYASSKLLNHDCDEEEEDIAYDSIFDSEGNWQEKHKRGIINVMDCYRISHEAYHELRHAGKGHFPPLYKIRLEKAAMSAEIPYIKHATVRVFVF